MEGNCWKAAGRGECEVTRELLEDCRERGMRGDEGTAGRMQGEENAR